MPDPGVTAPRVRALVIGDIGVVDGMFHVGDEAMFEATRDELRARGVEVVGVSTNPAESSARYGIDTVPRLGFAGLDRDAAAARSRLLVAAASEGLPPGDPAAPVLAMLHDCDALVNAGGGNLASRWPSHVVERGTLAAMAGTLGLPVVVTGQTIGPDLTDADAAVVAGMLRSAARVSVREAASQALVAAWGVTARAGVDDASFLGWDAAQPSGVLVSMSGWFAGRPAASVEAAMARLIDRAAGVVGGPVRFHAHFGPVDPAAAPRGDAAVHERVRALLRSPSEVVPTGDSRGAAALARGAALLITGRYHPAVFAAPAGVPTLGIHADEYTEIKLRGALEHWTSPVVVSLDDLDAAAPAAVESLHRDRASVAAGAASRFGDHRRAATRWWDAVADSLVSEHRR